MRRHTSRERELTDFIIFLKFIETLYILLYFPRQYSVFKRHSALFTVKKTSLDYVGETIVRL